ESDISLLKLVPDRLEHMLTTHAFDNATFGPAFVNDEAGYPVMVPALIGDLNEDFRRIDPALYWVCRLICGSHKLRINRSVRWLPRAFRWVPTCAREKNALLSTFCTLTLQIWERRLTRRIAGSTDRTTIPTGFAESYMQHGTPPRHSLPP